MPINGRHKRMDLVLRLNDPNNPGAILAERQI
jgi:hypothetical protein